MAQIEDVSMPLRNGTIVVGSGNQQAEQFVGPLSRAGKSFGQMRCTRHTHSLSQITPSVRARIVYAKESGHRLAPWMMPRISMARPISGCCCNVSIADTTVLKLSAGA